MGVDTFLKKRNEINVFLWASALLKMRWEIRDVTTVQHVLKCISNISPTVCQMWHWLPPTMSTHVTISSLRCQKSQYFPSRCIHTNILSTASQQYKKHSCRNIFSQFFDAYYQQLLRHYYIIQLTRDTGSSSVKCRLKQSSDNYPVDTFVILIAVITLRHRCTLSTLFTRWSSLHSKHVGHLWRLRNRHGLQTPV